MKRRNEIIYEIIQKIRKKMLFLYANKSFAKLLKTTRKLLKDCANGTK